MVTKIFLRFTYFKIRYCFLRCFPGHGTVNKTGRNGTLIPFGESFTAIAFGIPLMAVLLASVYNTFEKGNFFKHAAGHSADWLSVILNIYSAIGCNLK